MDDSPEGTSDGSPSARMAEVLRLSAALTDQVLDAQIMGREIPADRIAALVSAATLLQDHGVAWPALMEQVLHEFADRSAPSGPVVKPTLVEPIDEGPIVGLSRFLGAVRQEKVGT